MSFTTRFAPSPTGPLHLGHAYSALLAHDMATQAGGSFLLRIEDIDQTRARPEWEAQIFDDLHWLGLTWPAPVMRQSQRLPVYRDALQRLWDRGLIYACSCNRRDIIDATSAPQEGAQPTIGPDGIVYPGTCRTSGPRGPASRMPRDLALRLDMCAALDQAFTASDSPLFSFHETGSGPNDQTGCITAMKDEIIDTIGDVVLARRDFGASYHLCVVIDDAAQNVTHVVRGADLFEATKIHVVLQTLLGLPIPTYHHHRLIRDEAGKRLAKRDDARAIATFRAAGETPTDIRKRVGLPS